MASKSNNTNKGNIMENAITLIGLVTILFSLAVLVGVSALTLAMYIQEGL